MLTDDLTRSLAAHAPLLSPPPDLLARVERLEFRARRRRRALLSGTTVVLVLVAAVSVLGLHRTATRPSTLGPTSTVAPATTPLGGLTGSMCDPVGATTPLNFLTWPCVTPTAAGAKIIEQGLASELARDYGSVTHPRLRLIASDGRQRPNLLAEWWDADHPETPVQLIATNDHFGTNFPFAPAGDVRILLEDTAVFADAPIIAVRQSATGRVIQLSGGAASLPSLSGPQQQVDTLVGLDAAGHTQPGWSEREDGGYPDASLTGCKGRAGVGTCSDFPTYSLADAAVLSTGDCSTPADATPNYLDWPCVSADKSTGQRAAVAVRSVVATFGHITSPRARVIADTRDTGAGGSDGTATLVEIWDAGSTGPAVLAEVTGGADSETVRVDQNAFAHPGDPAGFLGSVLMPTDGATYVNENFYTRSSVRSVRAGGRTTHPVGGVTVLRLPISSGGGFGARFGAGVKALSADGQTLFTLGVNDGDAGEDPCGTSSGITGTTCKPSGFDPPPASTPSGVPVS